MSRICDQCNYENNDNATFCVNCGAELSGTGVVCPQCGAVIAPTDERCPKCGAVNGNYKRSQDLAPRTIEELQQWYKDRKLPPDYVTRFFIGQDYKGAKAFGIYKDTNGEFVVYKNKDTGARAVRYRGRDEAFAVNEIYTKLRETIQQQKSRPGYGAGSSSSSAKTASSSSKKKQNSGCLPKPLIIFVIIVLGILLFKGLINGACSAACSGCTTCVECTVGLSSCGATKGYYTSGDRTYYYDHGTWFLYDLVLHDWVKQYSEPSGYSDYSYSYSNPSGYSNATDSSAYDRASSSWSSSSSSGWNWGGSSSSSGWDDFWSSSDSDYDWDSGSSWDSDWGGGWDSDW